MASIDAGAMSARSIALMVGVEVGPRVYETVFEIAYDRVSGVSYLGGNTVTFELIAVSLEEVGK